MAAISTITPVSINHIGLDTKGRPLFIKHPRMRIEFVLTFFREDAARAMEHILENYDFLTPGEIYAALSYYEDNKAVIDEQFRTDLEQAERIFESMDGRNADMLEHFRKLKAGLVSDKSETNDLQRG